jgi:hypothetical protein
MHPKDQMQLRHATHLSPWFWKLPRPQALNNTDSAVLLELSILRYRHSVKTSKGIIDSEKRKTMLASEVINARYGLFGYRRFGNVGQFWIAFRKIGISLGLDQTLIGTTATGSTFTVTRVQLVDNIHAFNYYSKGAEPLLV